MKNFIMILSALILPGLFTSVASARTIEWSEGAEAGSVSLSQSITLGDGTQFLAGETFRFSFETGVPRVAAVYQEYVAENCPNPSAMSSEPVLVLPEAAGQPTGHDPSVAIYLDPGCKLGVYLEGRDYYSPSFFSAELP